MQVQAGVMGYTARQRSAAFIAKEIAAATVAVQV